MINVVPNENCLTEAQLLQYLRDECLPQEEKAIDRHLTHCPMCSDALEGAMLLNVPRLERSLAHLDAKIDTRFSDKKHIEKDGVIATEKAHTIDNQPIMTVVKKPARRWLWAAAGVAALAVAGISVLTAPPTMEKTVATTTLSDTLNPAPIDTIGTMATLPNGTVNTTDMAENAPQTGGSSTGIATAKTPVPTNNDVAVGTAATAPVTEKFEEKVVPATKVLPKADVVTTTSKPAASPISAPSQSAGTEGADKDAENAKSMTDAVTTTDAAKKTRQKEQTTTVQNTSTNIGNTYPGAAQSNVYTPSQSRAPKAKQPIDVDLADYKAGMKFYQKSAYADAIAPFNRFLAKQNSGDLYQNALWYLANCYLKLDKKADAKGLLQRIVAEKGVHAAEAAALLK